ncbi:MAG: FMN-binding protein [Oscillospiraceae bacterium]|nr:FMN-binding protein [Oscillospiraceae bacterium]
MKQKKKGQATAVSLLRRAIQILCFFLLPALFIQIFNSLKTVFLLLVHGQGTLAAAVPGILLLGVATLVTAITGRFFCGWMCAFGSLSDFLYRIPRLGQKRAKRRLTGADAALKWVKYLVLAAIVVLIWGLQILSIPAGTNPWDLFGMLLSFGSWPSPAELVSGWIPAALLLLGILAASVFVERFFCRYLCPLGAYFSLVSRLRPFAIEKRRKDCGACSLCSQRCGMGVALGKTDRVSSGDCINCMECVRCCPRGHAQLALSEEGKNVLVAGTLSCAMIAGAYYLGSFTGKAQSTDTASYTKIVTGVAANLPDGTYSGSGAGFRGQTTVSVTVSGGTITNITVDATGDNDEYMSRASSTVIAGILGSQSTDVDAVSGATYSSNAILTAVKNALASGGSAVETAASEAAETTARETTAVTTAETTAETTAAVRETETAASETGTLALADGTYQGSGTGLRGTTTVTVTVSGGKISSITVDAYEDDQQFFQQAKSGVIAAILAAQSPSVDAVSGATYSSNSIMEAVADALDLDYTPAVVSGGHSH